MIAIAGMSPSLSETVLYNDLNDGFLPHIWMSGPHKDVEQNYAYERGQGRLVVHQDHDDNAEKGADEGDPLVIVLERGPPSWRVGDAGVEDGEVDDGVGANEEVRKETGHQVEISDQDADQSHCGHHGVSTQGLSAAFRHVAEDFEAGEDVIRGHSLEHSRRANQGRNGRRERSGEASRVNQGTPSYKVTLKQCACLIDYLT